jgi:hypothetical protein
VKGEFIMNKIKLLAAEIKGNIPAIRVRIIEVADLKANLSDLRQDLEADSVMAREDSFLSKGQEEVKNEGESTVEGVCQAAGGELFLTMRIKPKKSPIVVAKDGATWHRKADLTQRLADLRVDLQADPITMTAEDKFWKGSGPILDEKDFNVADVIESGVVSIKKKSSAPSQPASGPSVVPETKFSVTVMRRAGQEKDLKDVDVAKTLDKLRTDLQGLKLMGSSDSFRGRDGKPIPRDQEEKEKVKDAFAKNAVLLVALDGWS